MDDDKRAELLMEHYKETSTLLQGHWKTRNRLFMYVLVLIAAIGLDCLAPGSLLGLVNGYLKKKLLSEADGWQPLGFAAVDLVARFVLLCLVIQYYQRSILVDRLYNYIHCIEENLCGLMGGDYVTREGKAYFSRKGKPDSGRGDRRPVFLRSVGPLYVYAFPVVLSSLVLYQVVRKGLAALKTPVGVLCALWSLAIVSYSVLYVVWVARRR